MIRESGAETEIYSHRDILSYWVEIKNDDNQDLCNLWNGNLNCEMQSRFIPKNAWRNNSPY